MIVQIELPGDINEYVLHIQMKKKLEKKTGYYSKEQAIIFLLRESMRVNAFTAGDGSDVHKDSPT